MAASEQGDGRDGDGEGVGPTPRAGGEARRGVFDGLGGGPLDMAALQARMQEDDERRILACLDRAIARRARPSDAPSTSNL